MNTPRLLPLAAALVLAACVDTGTDVPLDTSVRLESATEKQQATAGRVFEIAVTNLTDGQPLTPPIAATHDGGLSAFRSGQQASTGITQLAENGNGAALTAALQGDPSVSTVGGAAGPVFPGSSVTFTIDAAEGDTFLGWYSMLICTNDGFTGRDNLRLPSQVGQTTRARTIGYDAGTEINTEDFADIVPPCPALTGVPSSDPGTGMSNPALAENGRILPHRGVAGDDDLQVAVHDWKGSVSSVRITRIQ